MEVVISIYEEVKSNCFAKVKYFFKSEICEFCFCVDHEAESATEKCHSAVGNYH